MRSYLILPAVLGVALLSAPAMADQGDHLIDQPMTPSYTCTFLQNVVKNDLKTHANAQQFAQAKMLSQKAATLCANGNYTAGNIELSLARKDLNDYVVL